MPQNTLSYIDLIPTGFSLNLPDDLPFLFYRHRGNLTGLINAVSSHIERLDASKMRQIEVSLDLQFKQTSRDASGNVCFADDPHLRPEYRTGFHAIDLWDYYYALWHSPRWWASEKNWEEMPEPDVDLFWKLGRLGKKLRKIHALEIHTDQNQFAASLVGGVVQNLSDRFQPDEAAETTGRLFLNPNDYIDQVLVSAWEYRLGNHSLLSNYLNERIGERLEKDQFLALREWVRVVSETRMVVERIDRLSG